MSCQSGLTNGYTVAAGSTSKASIDRVKVSLPMANVAAGQCSTSRVRKAASRSSFVPSSPQPGISMVNGSVLSQAKIIGETPK